LGPASFRDLITRVDVETLRYGRLITRYAIRTGTWAEEPFSGGTNTSSRSVTLESLDLWSGTPEELASRSSHLESCGRCSGSGQVTCPSCHGTLRADCSGCGGSGQRMSRARKNYRMVNCSDCRGNGKKKCVRCSKGSVGCSPCRASGRMRRWLKVTTTERTQVSLWPEDSRLHAHPGLARGSPHALQWQGARTLETREHDGPIPPARVGPEAEAAGFLSARPSLEPGLEPLRGRILSQTLEVFEAPSATVHYAFSGSQGYITLLGSDFRPTPARDTRPFTYRFAWLLGVFFASFFGAVFLVNAYAERHDFYRRHPSSGFVALASLGLIPGLWLMTASWLRRRRADGSKSVRRWHDRLGLGLTGLCALFILGCFAFVKPSVGAVARLTASGELDTAELHASALQAAGDTSPEFIEARNAFVLARIPGMENRDAVKLITSFVHTKAGTQPLEAERRLRREAWFLSALSGGQEAEAERELKALSEEGAPTPFVDGLRARLENTRLEQGKALLAKGAVEDALSTLLRIQAPALAAEPPGPLVSHAYLLRARSCPPEGLRCRAHALKLAAEADPGEAARTALATFRSSEAVRLEKMARPAGGLGSSLRALQSAEVDARVLLSVFEGDTRLTEVQNGLLQRREALLRNRRPLGEPVEVAQALLGDAGLEERRPGVLSVREAPPDTLIHLFVSQGVTRGVHVTAKEHAREALATEALQEVARRLTGQTFAGKDLTRTGSGVAHVPARLGPHSALLGWQDGTLVEALIGKVDP
jgi:predicted outer membrane lipoprotein